MAREPSKNSPAIKMVEQKLKRACVKAYVFLINAFLTIASKAIDAFFTIANKAVSPIYKASKAFSSLYLIAATVMLVFLVGASSAILHFGVKPIWLIRLPQKYKTVIGKTAYIYESWIEGQKAIVLVFDEAENEEKVIQPVIKQNAESDFSARFAILEAEIKDLRTLIEKAAHFFTNIQKTDGPGAIRTPDLRRVKAEDLGGFEAFSVGDITVRKANDPLYIV